MKTWARLVLLFLAYGLALLHTAIPHRHIGSKPGEIVFSYTSCAYTHATDGLLQRAIATDLGVGHLETFKKSADTRIELSSRGVEVTAFLPRVCADIALRTVREFQNGFIRKLKIQVLLSSVTHFRAPPVTL